MPYNNSRTQSISGLGGIEGDMELANCTGLSIDYFVKVMTSECAKDSIKHKVSH